MQIEMHRLAGCNFRHGAKRIGKEIGIFKDAKNKKIDNDTNAQQFFVCVIFDHQLAPEPVEQCHRQDQQNKLRDKAHVKVIASHKKHGQPTNFRQNPKKQNYDRQEENIFSACENHLWSSPGQCKWRVNHDSTPFNSLE